MREPLPSEIRLGALLYKQRQEAGVGLQEAARYFAIPEERLSLVENGTGGALFLFEKSIASVTALYKLSPDDARLLSDLSKDCFIDEIFAKASKPSLLQRVAKWQADKMINRAVSEAARSRAKKRSDSPPGSGVFVNYRRSDQAALAGRIYDKLAAKFGEGQVFMDVDSIDLGIDFVHAIESTLSKCKAMTVVIGGGWLIAKGEDGNRRLDDPDDYVRLEIEMALKRDIRVIPILVDGTSMPRSTELPDSLRPLTRRNGRDIWNARFNSDCLELISTLERILTD
jgi:hypothetical protein